MIKKKKCFYLKVNKEKKETDQNEKQYKYVKFLLIFIFLFFYSIAYATSADISPLTMALPWPFMMFKDLAPFGLVVYFLKQKDDKNLKAHEIFFDTKNELNERVGDIEMIHKIRGCDQPDLPLKRRREDRDNE